MPVAERLRTPTLPCGGDVRRSQRVSEPATNLLAVVSGRVQGIWRYPVKSTRGEILNSATCTSQGLEGDREWGVLGGDGTVVSAKSPRHGGALLSVLSGRHEDGTTLLVLPSGSEVTAGTAVCDHALTALLGWSVHVSKTATPGLRLHRLWPTQAGLVPGWHAHSRPGDMEKTTLAGADRGSFVDFGPLHVLTVGAVSQLERQLSETLDLSRLRPNLLLGLHEDPEPDQILSIGSEVLLRMTLPTPRCIVPALPQLGLPLHGSLLGVLAKHHRRDVPGLGRATCFGRYADVVQPGVIRLNDVITVD